MHLYDELQEVKAPPYSHSDGLRVYIDYDVGGGRTKRLYIGYYTDKEQGMMHVNDNIDTIVLTNGKSGMVKTICLITSITWECTL